MVTGTTFVEITRVVFLISAALYFGIAYRVLCHYFKHAPRTSLRRKHVIGVSLGTSLLVGGFAGTVLEKIADDDPLVWYGAPLGFAGVVSVTIALYILSREQRGFDRRKGENGPNKGRRIHDRDIA